MINRSSMGIFFLNFYWREITNTNENPWTISIYDSERDYIGKYERSYRSHINQLLLVI